jgi:hypothetical protein
MTSSFASATNRNADSRNSLLPILSAKARHQAHGDVRTREANVPFPAEEAGAKQNLAQEKLSGWQILPRAD